MATLNLQQTTFSNLTVTASFVKINMAWYLCADPEGDEGVRIPLENHKNIVFLNNTAPKSSLIRVHMFASMIKVVLSAIDYTKQT